MAIRNAPIASLMRRGRWPGVLATALLVPLAANPLAAQRFTANGVLSRGDRPETRTAVGFSARLTIPVVPLLGFAVGYSRVAGRSDLDGTPCASYWPESAGCVDESLRNDLQFGTVDYEVFLPVPLLGFEVLAAGGVDVTTVERATLHGTDTGRDIEVPAPDHDVFQSLTSFNGYHYRVSLGFNPFVAIPLAVRLAWQHRVYDLDACAESGYAPFCGRMESNEVLLGLSIGTR